MAVLTLDDIKPSDEIATRSSASVISKLRKNFATRNTRDLKFRIRQLNGLQQMVLQNQDLLVEALKRDLNKPYHETVLCEIALLNNDIKMFKSNLRNWASPQHKFRNISSMFDSVYVQPEPYGVVLIISAWNYPIFLSLRPMIGAIAAGNCVILKPSEISPNIARVLQELLPRYIDSNFYEVVQGGPEETQQLLQERFDQVFYTGSPQVGAIVYQAAAKYLTPVTLELGGKSPVYFADDSVRDLDLFLQRFLFGKLVNLGQTCIAPDYIMCSERIQKLIVERIPALIEKEYGSDLIKSDRLARIVNERHTNRLINLIETSKNKLVYGGSSSVEDKWIHPSIFTNCTPDDPIMQQELFGPLMPIMVVNNEDDAIDYINRNEKPLALYVFTYDSKIKKKFVEKTSSGTCCINETIMFMGIDTLPFGGVGTSGTGCYNGKYSFDTFSHEKAVLDHSTNIFVRTLEGMLKYGEMTKTKIFCLKELLAYRQYYLIPSICSMITFMFGLGTGLLLFISKDRFLK